jgi:hypothetical protein
MIYSKHKAKPVEPQFLAEGWYYDAAVSGFMGGPGRAGFNAIAWFDANIVDGAVNGIAHCGARHRATLPHRAERQRPQLRRRDRCRRGVAAGVVRHRSG